MSNSLIKKGDIVWLKSGGPKMTVQHIDDEQACQCVWFHCGEIKVFKFDSSTLIPYDPSEAEQNPPAKIFSEDL